MVNLSNQNLLNLQPEIQDLLDAPKYYTADGKPGPTWGSTYGAQIRDAVTKAEDRIIREAGRDQQQAGIDTNRMEYVSWGKERPEVIGSDETAYSQNRRGVTLVSN